MAPARLRHPIVMALALVCGAGAGAAPPATASRAEGATSGLTERASVELVLIEVYATDGRGRPILSLTANDFSLSIDGYAKPIHSVEFRGISDAPASPQVRGAASPTPATGTVPASLARRFVLFFDDGTSAPNGLTAARKAARSFLEGGLLPGDQVAIASFGRTLRILHDFTTDRAALVGTIDTSLGDLSRFGEHASEQALWEGKFAELAAHAGHDTGGREFRTAALNYAEEFTPRSRAVLRALTTLVHSLAPYPGYKAIVFMGDGVPENPAVDFAERFGTGTLTPELLSRTRKFDLSHEIQILAHDASAAGVTLHSVQTTGQTAATGSEMRATGRRSNGLETLALNTGGTKSTSNDLLKGLKEAESSGRAYYVIAYAPDDPPDGRYHTVQVRLKHGSGQLRWRRGFTRLLPEQARQHSIEAAYAFPELSPDLGVEISAVAGPASEGARVYDLVLHLPPGRAVFVAAPDGAAARLEAGFVVIDDMLRETTRASREVRIAVKGGRATDGFGIDFYSRIRAPRGAQTVTAVVSDLTAGALGAARLRIPEAADRPATLVGLSMYSMVEKSLWIEIPPGSVPSAQGEAAAEYASGPALKTTFAVGESVACGFRLDEEAPAAEVRLAIRRGGQDLRSAAVAARGGSGEPGAGPGFGSMGALLPLEGLSAGEYEVVVRRRTSDGIEFDAGVIPLRLLDTAASRAPDREPEKPRERGL